MCQPCELYVVVIIFFTLFLFLFFKKGVLRVLKNYCLYTKNGDNDKAFGRKSLLMDGKMMSRALSKRPFRWHSIIMPTLGFDQLPKVANCQTLVFYAFSIKSCQFYDKLPNLALGKDFKKLS